MSRLPNAAQRALSHLDAYKTPLFPTRALASTADKTKFLSSSSAGVFDMYSRKTKRLELLKDDRERKRLENLGAAEVKETESPLNSTKPYAGSGGLRKLLKRRQQEEISQKDGQGSDSVLDKPAPVPLVPSSKNWYSTTSTTNQGSSLRVGRTKTSRNHFSRPSAPANNRFSAFEEDGDDDADEERRQREKDELDEAAKKAPKFSIPAGFTFAKDVRPFTVFSCSLLITQ